VDTAAEQLAILARPPKTVEPGEYRVYLAPSALRGFLETVAWGGFGLKAHRTNLAEQNETEIPHEEHMFRLKVKAHAIATVRLRGSKRWPAVSRLSHF